MVRLKKPKIKRPKLPKPPQPKKPEINVKLPDPKKIVREIEQGADKAKRSAVDGIQKEGNRAVNDVRGKGRWYISEVEKGGKQAVTAVSDAERTAITAIEREAIPAMERAILALASEGMKPALKAAARTAHQAADGMDYVADNYPALTKELDKIGFNLKLKVNVEITLRYKNFYTRGHEVAGILDRYANDGLKLRRRDIRGFIVALGPDVIDFGGGASLAFGLDVGAVLNLMDLTLPVFVELADFVMKEMGVPE